MVLVNCIYLTPLKGVKRVVGHTQTLLSKLSLLNTLILFICNRFCLVQTRFQAQVLLFNFLIYTFRLLVNQLMLSIDCLIIDFTAIFLDYSFHPAIFE